MMGRNLLLLAAGVGAYMGVRALIRSQRKYDLRGKTVVITGGSRGLGLVMAREFARRGARLALCARDANELHRAMADLEQYDVAAEGYPCDVTDREQVEDMVGAVRGRFGRIDVLVNNAGVIAVGPAEVMTLADYEEAMKTHFWAPLYTILAVAPEMKARGEGRIVNISSIGGKVAVPHLVPYCASKFALVGLSEGLRAELARHGVLVTTVVPGLMRTGSPRNAIFKGRHREEYALFAIADSLPLATISAQRAAWRVVEACKYGDAQVVLSLPAKVAVLVHDLFPELTSDLMALTNRAILPEPGGIGTRRAKGKDSESVLAPSFLTALTEEAARENNEMSVR